MKGENILVGGSVIGLFAIFGIFIAGSIGWVLNIVAVAQSSFDPLTGIVVLRCIGIFVPPLGAVLGYI